MSLWTEIVNTALIGCERKSLSLNGATGELGDLLAQLDQNDREGALLSAAAIVSLYERAATLPIKDTQPSMEACEPDDTPRCSERAENHLAMMLRKYQGFLPEWLEKTIEAGLRLPEESLPQLLEYGRTQKSMRKEINHALRARGRWLTAQNPDWAYAVAEVDETLWETGNHHQRRPVLAELRKRDAARGRKLLASSWARELPKDRISFLYALYDGLSIDDESFLEAALDDPSKDVRARAARLLARLPESALSGRMLERVRPLIRFKLDGLKGKTIEITLPEVCDETMQRDGIDPKSGHAHIDDRSWWLEQMLGLIPPKVWSQESGWSVSELIEAAKRSESESVLPGESKNKLLEVWAQAAQLCRDAEWAAKALLAAAIDGEGAVLLFNILPQTRQEDVIIELLRTDPLIDTSQGAYSYVSYCLRQWGEALSRALIDNLLHNVAKGRLKWSGLYYRVAWHLYPALIPETISRFTEAAKALTERRAELEPFLNLIQFRHEMLKEF